MSLGINGRGVPGVRLLRYAPKVPARVSDVPETRDFETKIVRGMACARAMAQLQTEGFVDADGAGNLATPIYQWLEIGPSVEPHADPHGERAPDVGISAELLE